MSGRADSIGPYQPLPFAPALFYAVPHEWLADVRETGDLDTRQLLLAMNNGLDALVVFPPDRNEAYWTRAHSEGLPNVVSHPTYQRYLRALIADGRLQVADEKATTSQVYVLTGWSSFVGAGCFFVPRAYIEHRWPAWLGQSQWAPRAALLAFLAKMTAEKAGVLTAVGQPLEVTAYVKELRQNAQKLLPVASVADKVGSGMTMLADLGLVSEVARSRSNRCYRLRSDAFDRPPAWPLAEIAARCELDLARDEPWVALIQAFLRHNFWPITRSMEVWTAIRHYAPDAVTHDQARAIERLLAQRAARGRVSRAATHPRTVLKDYVALLRRPWCYGPAFRLPLTPGASSEPGMWLPVTSPANIDTTQLVVRPSWVGRLRHDDVLALLQGTRWFLRQPAARYVEQLIELPLPLRPDHRAFMDGVFLEGNHMHTALDYAVPFRVVVEPSKPQPQLTLHCQFRVLLGRTAAVERPMALERASGDGGQSTRVTPQLPDPM
jgi:hypothetical protein